MNDAQSTLLTNLALDRPARQSSICRWSRHQDVEQDARGANNGIISGEQGFHTDEEVSPWWQVDLEGEYVIEKVVIYNRVDDAWRLTHFTLLRSLDGEHWVPMHRKTDETVFGTDGTPYEASIPGEQLARYVRVRLDGTSCLHFNECQVYGRIPDAGRLDELRALAGVAQTPMGHMVTIEGLQVWVDDESYDPTIVQSLNHGWYEGRERAALRDLLRPGQRVLEIGTAIGVVAMTAARIVGAENVLTLDANPAMVAASRANFERNGLSGIQSRHGTLKNRRHWKGPDEVMEFYIARAFWASRAVAGDDTVDVVRCPVACLEDEIAKHRAEVFICDIEGGEIDLLTEADLSGIQLILMETHYWAVGEAATDAMMRRLIMMGFDMDLGRSGNHVSILRRGTVPA